MLHGVKAPIVLDPKRLEDLIASALARGDTPRAIADEILAVLSDRRANKAISHPVRQKTIALLRAAGPLSPVQIARHVDGSLGTVSYHVRALHELGVIELVGTRPKRGALEHIYALVDEDRTAVGSDAGDEDRGVTIAQAAEIVNKTPQTIRNWIAAGRLRPISERPIRIPRGDLFSSPQQGRRGRPSR